jgi:hypothetical protein
VVEGEEALDTEVAAVEDFLVNVGASLLEVIQTVRHLFLRGSIMTDFLGEDGRGRGRASCTVFAFL